MSKNICDYHHVRSSNKDEEMVGVGEDHEAHRNPHARSLQDAEVVVVGGVSRGVVRHHVGLSLRCHGDVQLRVDRLQDGRAAFRTLAGEQVDRYRRGPGYGG